MKPSAPEERVWLGGGAGWIAAALYARGVAFARARALSGPRVQTARPLISVGNLSVGGTGKTPCTVWLAHRLLSEGHGVALVARPVGGAVPGAAGDELAVLAELVPEALVVPARVKSDGALAADRALAEGSGHNGRGVIVVDDAFSHWRLERALDVVLLHAPRPLGNGHVLPLGPLREPPTSLARAGVVVLTRADRLALEELGRTREAVAALAPGAVVAAARLVPGPITRGGHGAPVRVPSGQTAVCLSGLARPDELARSAGALGLSVEDALCYPDHHRFRGREWRAAVARADRLGAWLVTSRKDAVRLGPEQRLRVHVLDVAFEFIAGEDEVLRRIRAAIE